MTDRLAEALTRADDGLLAPLVRVEVHVSSGLPGLVMVGLPETTVREARERVRSALMNSGFDFPMRRITVHLAPANLRKRGARFDLAIAMGILCASGQLPPQALHGREFVSELGLGGQLQPVTPLTAAALACRDAGREMVVAAGSAPQVQRVPDCLGWQAGSLAQLCQLLVALAEGEGGKGGKGAGKARRGKDPAQPAMEPQDIQAMRLCGQAPQVQDGAAETGPDLAPDLAEVRGQQAGRRALEIAAAGGHNLLYLGPPGSGKTMLARRLVGLLGPLSVRQSLQTAMLHEASDLPPPPWGRPPLRAPHHTASIPGLIGGGAPPRPGEISLAHNGVLLLDEAAELPRMALESFRQPVESGDILVSRGGRKREFPADCLLALTMNPCPCGYLGDPQIECKCSPAELRTYARRLSGPFLDRIDLRLRLERGESLHAQPGETSQQVRQRVQAARSRCRAQAGRNARLTDAELRQHCRPGAEGRRLLSQAAERWGISDRGLGRVLRVARTIADLAGQDEMGREHLMEALMLRRMPPPFDQGPA